MTLGQIAIEDIQLDARCRDDIPAVLKGIQHIYCDPSLRECLAQGDLPQHSQPV